MERYKYKPQIIRCFNCQGFGHVARLCKSQNPVCGKCTSKEHNTKECTVAPNNFKCFHCGENHQTGNRHCEAIKLKTEELSNP